MKTSMKMLYPVLLLCCLALALCACGSTQSASGPTDAPAGTAVPAADPTEVPIEEASNDAPAGTISFTDDCGRTVELPAEITRAAPSGAVANMFLAAAAPDCMVCVSDSPTAAQTPYLDAGLTSLPVTGSLYGGKGDANLEALLAAGPQLIIDMGDLRSDTAESLDLLQAQIGVPCVFLEADLTHMADAFLDLGALLSGKADRCSALAEYVEETVTMAEAAAAAIPDSERVRVMYTSGADGLGTNSRGSTQAQVIELVGAVNAIETAEVINKNGGNLINPEQLYLSAPDVILFTPGSIYDTVADDPTWAQLDAVNEGRYYEVPAAPYNWLSNPPSMNMLLGVRWLGNLLYPEQYGLDMVAETQFAFQLLWNYDLSVAEAEEILANSVIKQ